MIIALEAFAGLQRQGEKVRLLPTAGRQVGQHRNATGIEVAYPAEQIQAALDGAKALPASFKGITRVWTKTLKAQNAQEVVKKRTHIIVMEFADEKALADYSGSDAQKAWYKLYTPIRDQSTTHDITN